MMRPVPLIVRRGVLASHLAKYLYIRSGGLKSHLGACSVKTELRP